MARDKLKCWLFAVALIWLGLKPITAFAEETEGAPSPFLTTLVEEGGVVVAYGTGTRSLEAANIIRDAIRQIPGQANWDNVISAVEFDSMDMNATGKTNVIAVGTLANNVVLQDRGWLPTWWLDREWYYNHYKPDGKKSYALMPEELKMPYMPKTGFVFAGYGEWPQSEGRLGYVEVDRNPFYMEWLVRTRMANSDCTPGQILAMSDIRTPGYATETSLFMIVHVVGSGDAGEVAAAEAFAHKKMLNGLVLNGAEAAVGPKMFTLPQNRYYIQPPFDPPEESAGYTYQGWLLSDAFMYDGFVADSAPAAPEGAAPEAPQVIYRLKYKPEWGIKNFWSSPHRRAGAFEVMAAKFASEQDANDAMANLKASLQRRKYADRVSGCNMVVKDKILYVESFPEPAGANVLAAFQRLANW